MIIRPDDHLVKGPGRWNAKDVGEAWATCYRQLREAFADPKIIDVGVLVGIPGAGKTTWANHHDDPRLALFDAVWSKRARRVAMARRIREHRKLPVAVWVRAPLSLALARNATRPPWRQVPEAFIRQAHADLRRAPPSRAEGWVRVIIVDNR